jgi:hypothetical protein
LVAINLFKNIIVFILIYVAADWIKTSGYLEVLMIFFALTMIGLIFAVPLYFFGPSLRRISRKIYDFEKDFEKT